MESDTTIQKKHLTAKQIADKFGLKGEILSFDVPARGNSKNVSDKHLLFILQIEGENEQILSKGRIKGITKKIKNRT